MPHHITSRTVPQRLPRPAAACFGSRLPMALLHRGLVGGVQLDEAQRRVRPCQRAREGLEALLRQLLQVACTCTCGCVARSTAGGGTLARMQMACICL